MRSALGVCALTAAVAVIAAACGDTAVVGGGGASSTSTGGGGGTGGGGDCIPESCNGLDDDCDGVVDEDCVCTSGEDQECYTASPATAGIAGCQHGFQLCEDQMWGACLGEVVPSVEICNGFDDDCDGLVDNGCPCDAGQEQSCYSGNPITVDIGRCARGTQSCVDDSWGVCADEILPTIEICNGQDNDCDGVDDDDCVPPVISSRCDHEFEDVPPGYWAYEHIHALYIRAIANGCSVTPLLFCPLDPTLRRNFAIMLIKSMGETPSGAAMNEYFSDLSHAGTAGYVNRLHELGITSGCGDGLYCPDDPTTRQHAAVFIIRGLGEPASNVPQDEYFDDLQGTTGYGYVNRLFELGLTTGCGDRLFCPNEPALRDQAATLLSRAFDYDTAMCDP